MGFVRDIRKLTAIRDVVAKWKHPVNTESGLSNPSARAEIRGDFPGTVSPYSAEAALQLIGAELEKRGTSLNDVKRINIAYPHKHKGLHPNHHNSAEERALAFQEKMQRIAPEIDWVLAEALSERKHLNRSGDQSSLHALTGRQEYDVYMPAQKQPFPFADKASTEKEYFVIVDNTIEQGTTIANLMSYIAHNNGDVLMVQADRHTHIAQAKTDIAGLELSAPFNDASRNSGRLPELAKAFSVSAKKAGQNWSPQESIEKFEAALQRHGNSVFALTNGEVDHIVKTVSGTLVASESFPELLGKLEKSAKKLPAFRA